MGQKKGKQPRNQNKRSGSQGPTLGQVLFGGQKPRKSKGQDSTKVHNTKGKNTHGRTKW